MAVRDAGMGVSRFCDDDEGYLRWLDMHPDGFVINTYRRPSRGYLMLHKAECRTIRGAKRWTADYIKICSVSAPRLREWAVREVGGVPTACGHCRP